MDFPLNAAFQLQGAPLYRICPSMLHPCESHLRTVVDVISTLPPIAIPDLTSHPGHAHPLLRQQKPKTTSRNHINQDKGTAEKFPSRLVFFVDMRLATRRELE